MKYEIDFENIPSPCFLLDERKLIHNLNILKEVEELSGASILCALKAYAMWSTFPILKEYISGATASSLNEAKLVDTHWNTKAHVCAPVLIPSQFEEIKRYASHITFNSLTEWNRYKKKLIGTTISPALRINPLYSEVEVDLYNPANTNSRLGVQASELKNLPEGIKGLHFHVLCEQDSYVLERVLDKVEQDFGHLLPLLDWINFGGGHHITRNDYDRKHLISIIKSFRKKYDIDVILEPGEAIGWETGYLVSEVMDIFPNGDKQIAMLNTSFSCHMPDCLEMPYKPFIVGAIEPNEFFPTYIMGGMTCLAGDQIGDYSFVKDLKVGEKVIFHDMIHYTMVKTNTFNGVDLPSIAIWTKEDELKMIKKYSYQDFESRLS